MQRPVKKIAGQTILMIALSAALYVIAVIGINYKSKSSENLELIWAKDIKNLVQHNSLPAHWIDIRLIEKVAAQDDPLAENWSKSVSSPIEINPKGDYKLEVLFLSQEENGHLRAVIEHHLVHIPTGNTVWELGRTYLLN